MVLFQPKYSASTTKAPSALHPSEATMDSSSSKTFSADTIMLYSSKINQPEASSPPPMKSSLSTKPTATTYAISAATRAPLKTPPKLGPVSPTNMELPCNPLLQATNTKTQLKEKFRHSSKESAAYFSTKTHLAPHGGTTQSNHGSKQPIAAPTLTNG